MRRRFLRNWKDGRYSILSVVTFTEKQFFVGAEAKENEEINQSRQTIRCVKRLIGHSSADIQANGEEKLINYRYEDLKGKTHVCVKYRHNEQSF